MLFKKRKIYQINFNKRQLNNRKLFDSVTIIFSDEMYDNSQQILLIFIKMSIIIGIKKLKLKELLIINHII